MSMRKRLGRNAHGEPRLTIVVEGTHDVYRTGWYLQHASVEHARLGRNIHRSLRRFVGGGTWQWLLRYFHGDGGFR